MQGALRLNCGSKCLARVEEGSTECISDRFENGAIVALDRLPYDGIVRRQRDTHRVGAALPEFGAALDVGEQKGHDAGWKRSSHGSVLFG